METDLDVRIHRFDDIPIVGLSGDVDTYTCMKVKEAILELIDKGDFRVVINMAGVDYIDSSGLGTLIGGLRRLGEEDGCLAISSAKPQILKVFNVTGLNRIFSIFDDDADAVKDILS